MEVFNVFEEENHLKPNFDKSKFIELKGWDLGWELLNLINIANSTDEDKELSKRFSPGQKALYFFWYLDSEVTNGGFVQFYENGFSSYLPTIKEGLKLIGDYALIELINLADDYYISNQIRFDKLSKSDNYDVAITAFKEFDKYNKAYYQIHDNTIKLLELYARKHPEDFANLI